MNGRAITVGYSVGITSGHTSQLRGMRGFVIIENAREVGRMRNGVDRILEIGWTVEVPNQLSVGQDKLCKAR